MVQKNHFYAVRKGRKPGIYKTWDEARREVTGFSGAEYKGFVTLEEAQAFMGTGKKEEKDERHVTDLIAFVDGSYNHSLRAYAYGVVILTEDEELTFSGRGEDPEAAKLRNVYGEMQGAKSAVSFCLEKGYSSIEIRYDYEGIEKWVNGAWRAGNVYTQEYARFMQEAGRKIRIYFQKVRAHTGVHYNEMADKLAKEALSGRVVERP